MVQIIKRPVYTIKPHLVNDYGGNLKFALVANGYSIHSPFESECGRFEVNPVDTYGLTMEDAKQLVDLNDRLELAYANAVDALAQAYQVPFGVTDGQSAGNYFTGPINLHPMQRIIINLVYAEFELLIAD